MTRLRFGLCCDDPPPMAATTTMCYHPSFTFLQKNLLNQRYLKNTSFGASIFPSKSISCGGFVPRKAVLGIDRLWVPNTMNKSTRTSAFSNETSDQNIQVLEQQAFTDGSSEFRPKFLSREVESTLNRMSKWMVTALFASFIIWRHDPEALWFAAGSVLNAILSILLKRILNQERPTTLKSDPGMPSTHSQSIFFTALFVILSSVEWLGLNAFTITCSGITLAIGSFFAYLRVSQQLHTVSQVVVGAIIGSISSILWYWFWNAFMLDAFSSSIVVRAIVVSGSAGICAGFVLFAIRNWLQDD